MKVHFIFTFIIVVTCLILKVSFVDFLFLIFAITFVLIAEMLNTSLEMIMDMISETYHPLVRIAKDVSAGAVLIATITAIIVGYLILSKYLSEPAFIGLSYLLKSPWYITLISILVVLIISIGIKIFLGKGTPFYGGMPSAHSALAFSIWTIVTILTKNALVMTLTFVVALMVAQGRIASGAHNFREVLFGALLGVLLSFLIFQFVYK
jgi:diacylglycerol kinase (ATP)